MAETIPGSKVTQKRAAGQICPWVRVCQSMCWEVSYPCSVFHSHSGDLRHQLCNFSKPEPPQPGNWPMQQGPGRLPRALCPAADSVNGSRFCSGKRAVLLHRSPQELSFWSPRTWLCVDWECKQVRKNSPPPLGGDVAPLPLWASKNWAFSPEKGE